MIVDDPSNIEDTPRSFKSKTSILAPGNYTVVSDNPKLHMDNDPEMKPLEATEASSQNQEFVSESTETNQPGTPLRHADLRTHVDKSLAKTGKRELAEMEDSPFVDPYYNETYLYLIPRDSKSLFIIWEVSEDTRVYLTRKFGEDFFEHNKLILRVSQVTDVDYDGTNSNYSFEVDDDLHWKCEYWVEVTGGEYYLAEIGYRAAGTDFFERVASSNTVFIPRNETTTAEKYAEWDSVEVDPNNVEMIVAPDEWRLNLYHYWKNRRHHAPDERGYWSLVLHQHLPFVRHPEHDVSLEEQWFFEAVVSVYTQLLHLFWELERDKVDFRLTVSFSPTLISMMRDPLLKMRAARHIDECIAFATQERDNSQGKPWHDTVEQTLHRFHLAREVFRAYEGDLTRGYRDFQKIGKLEIITCPATHMILPLFNHFPEVIRAQLRFACEQYQRVFERAPRGVWLPENAFTPGIDRYLAEQGLKWSLGSARSILSGDTRAFYDGRLPVITPSGVAAFGIDEETRQQVWSRESGYPGHMHYKEWYRDVGYDAEWDYLPPYFKTANVRRNTGIKYHRITGQEVQLSEKDYYNIPAAEAAVNEHAAQFVYYRGVQVNHLHDTMGVKPCVVSAYDAELFGHWWEEGPAWINSVFRKMLYDQNIVRPITPSEYLAENPRHQKLMPGAASWGKKNFFSTWVDGREYQPNCWVFRHYYRLCGRLQEQAIRYKTTTDPRIIRTLNQAVRELFLAVSSDWGFLIETGQAVRYAELKIVTHLDRTRQLLTHLESGKLDSSYLETLEEVDTIFPGEEMDFRVFCP
ncbi:MAG: DUF1957 domain-containing protein [Planctomycetes bacterium]|nr:DUF1957 domain-containing protein [Planctomycetota bacterium]